MNKDVVSAFLEHGSFCRTGNGKHFALEVFGQSRKDLELLLAAAVTFTLRRQRRRHVGPGVCTVLQLVRCMQKCENTCRRDYAYVVTES